MFPFSAREGTPASRMPQVHGAVVARRAAALREKGVSALRAHLANARGARIEILLENEEQGRAPDFTPVKLASRHETGVFVKAQVCGHDGSALLATVAA